MARAVPLTVLRRLLGAEEPQLPWALSRIARREVATASIQKARPAVVPRDAGDIFGGPPRTDLGAVPPALAGSFYQRSLPVAQVAFASEEGRRLFREALEAGHMENYFFLAEQFRTQDEPTFCGLSTLAMALNSLRIDPMRTWKGAWRWFNEENLGCCTGLNHVRAEGLTFDMFKCLAGCNGADVSAHRAPDVRIGSEDTEGFADAFRAAVRAASRSQERECLIACYTREVLGQSGAGHFSPIGGYHEGTDSVLIMDVARFKYPPHWVPLREVAAAMSCIDKDTGRTRGYLHLRAHPKESDPRHNLKPLHIPFVPAAAGRRLAVALSSAMPVKADSATASSQDGAWATVAVNRWLQAACEAERQVLGQLLQVGDVAAAHEVLGRLANFPVYKELCDAYAHLTHNACSGCLAGEFPPLRFTGDAAEQALPADGELGLATCGELWILLLLLLPEHLRASISDRLAGPRISQGMARAVRGPWALPLEALREALDNLLPSPAFQICSHTRLPSAH